MKKSQTDCRFVYSLYNRYRHNDRSALVSSSSLLFSYAPSCDSRTAHMCAYPCSLQHAHNGLTLAHQFDAICISSLSDPSCTLSLARCLVALLVALLVLHATLPRRGSGYVNDNVDITVQTRSSCLLQRTVKQNKVLSLA